MNEMPIYGRIHGRFVSCNLCRWEKQCFSDEQVEHYFAQHLWLAHGKTLLYRQKSDGTWTEVPVIETEESTE